jgi:hypothetical protein
MKRYIVVFEQSAQADDANLMIGVDALGASTKQSNGFANCAQRFQSN